MIRRPPRSTPLSLHDALPIFAVRRGGLRLRERRRPIEVRDPRDEGPRRDACRGELRNGFARSEEHTSELQSRRDLVCRLLLEKKKRTRNNMSFAHKVRA